jgi:hypothetical protein
MRNSVSIFFSAILVSTNVMAGSTGAVVFPGPEDVLNKNKCTVVQRPCTFDEGQICTVKYCGVQIKQAVLDTFVKNHQLIGRRFPSIFDLETYVKKNLPPELSYMTVAFSYKKSDLKNYNPNRINILLDSKDYINKIVIE